MENADLDNRRVDMAMSRMDSQPVAVSAFLLLMWAGLVVLPFLIWDNVRKAVPPSPLLLPQQVNPNQADLALLICLPRLGPYRARAIIRFRKEHRHTDPNQPVFRRPEDLIAVKGIGPATLKAIIPYLCFGTTTVLRDLNSNQPAPHSDSRKTSAVFERGKPRACKLEIFPSRNSLESSFISDTLCGRTIWCVAWC